MPPKPKTETSAASAQNNGDTTKSTSKPPTRRRHSINQNNKRRNRNISGSNRPPSTNRHHSKGKGNNGGNRNNRNKSNKSSLPRTSSTESLPSTAVASESLQQMVHEMEYQLQNVLASPVFDAVRRDSGLSAEEQALPTSMTEEEDAFGEVEPPNFGEVVRTVEVPRWLSDEGTVEHLLKSIKEKRLEEEYQCTIELSGRGTNISNGNYNNHLLIKMKGTDSRQLGRVRRGLEDSLISHLVTITPKSTTTKSRTIYPPSLGRLLYNFAISSTNNSPRWHDRHHHRTVLARNLLPLYTTNKVWMNIVELPTDSEGKFHGMFLAGKGGRFFELYREKFGCRVDIFGDFSKRDANGGDENEEGDNEANHKYHHASTLLCDPYVLVTSRESKQNVDNCLQFIEHRIRDHAEQWGVSRNREVERIGEQRRMRRSGGEKTGGGRKRDGKKEDDK